MNLSKKSTSTNLLGSMGLCLLISTISTFSGTINANDDMDLKMERFDQALSLKPNKENGKELYHLCVTCHGPEGWGTRNGSYPQIAGQLHSVTIKQLGDICSKQRGNPIMEAFTSPKVLQSAQDVADLAAYIEDLPMTSDNGKGNDRDLELGQKLYQDLCQECHGDDGKGHRADHIPRLQGQHYNYLMRQFSWIRGGHRRNADEKMIKQIQNMTMREQSAVMAYVASLKPPKEDLAKTGWTNPDFPNYDRRWSASSPREKPLNQ